MGDLYEYTTWPKHQNIFYKLSNDALVFYIKGEKNAAIGLARNSDDCDYWILIDVNQQCWIKMSNGRSCCSVFAPNILSRDKYKKFWITVKKGEINLGQNNRKSPILSQQTPLHNLHYFTFSVLGERTTLHWKCHLPPQIEKPALIPMKSGVPKWVHADDQLPDDAFIGGHEKGVLYIIRAHHRGSLTPGKFVPELGLGFVPWGGEMHEKSEFEVLCGHNCTWIKTTKNKIPLGAVEGGYSEDGNEILYIGRLLHDSHLIPGKVQASHNCCYISYNDKEIANQDYEILVVPHSMNSACNFYMSCLGIRNFMTTYTYDSDGPEENDNEMYIF